MKKVDVEMRSEYKRTDFVKLERGKFFKEVAKGTSVALIDPKLAKAFPTSEAVNQALRGLLALARCGCSFVTWQVRIGLHCDALQQIR
jgi:hypothetical protein